MRLTRPEAMGSAATSPSAWRWVAATRTTPRASSHPVHTGSTAARTTATPKPIPLTTIRIPGTVSQSPSSGGERLVDAQSGSPQHDDQRAQALPMGAVAGGAHGGDDLLDRRRVRGIADLLCCAAGVRRGIPASWPVNDTTRGRAAARSRPSRRLDERSRSLARVRPGQRRSGGYGVANNATARTPWPNVGPAPLRRWKRRFECGSPAEQRSVGYQASSAPSVPLGRADQGR